MLDCSTIGALAAETMETVSTGYPDDTIRTVAIVVEVDRGETTTLIVRSSEDRRWALQAFLNTAADWLEDRPHVSEVEEDEEECDG